MVQRRDRLLEVRNLATTIRNSIVLLTIIDTIVIDRTDQNSINPVVQLIMPWSYRTAIPAPILRECVPSYRLRAALTCSSACRFACDVCTARSMLPMSYWFCCPDARTCPSQTTARALHCKAHDGRCPSGGKEAAWAA